MWVDTEDRIPVNRQFYGEMAADLNAKAGVCFRLAIGLVLPALGAEAYALRQTFNPESVPIALPDLVRWGIIFGAPCVPVGLVVAYLKFNIAERNVSKEYLMPDSIKKYVEM